MISKTSLTGAAAAALLLMMAAPSDAAVVVSLEDAFPTDGSIASEFTGPPTGSIAWRRQPSGEIPAVTFLIKQPTAASIGSFGLMISAANGGGSFTLTIRESATLPSSGTAGTSIFSETTMMSIGSFESTTEDPITKMLAFDLGETLDLKADYYYSFRLVWSAGAESSKRIVIRYGVDESGFSQGSWDTSNTTYRESRDYILYTAVPEPGALALLALPGVVLALRRMRKGKEAQG